MKHTSQTDDFLKALKADLPQDFAQDLYRQLEEQEEQDPMLTTTRKPPITGVQWPMRLVAAAVLLIAGIMISTIWLTDDGNLGALAPTTEPIQQADPQPELIATYGDGSANSIAFLPDSDNIIMATSRGVYVHDGTDLSRLNALDDTPTSILGQSDDLNRVATRENRDTLTIRDTLTWEAITQAPLPNIWYTPRFDATLDRAMSIACAEEQVTNACTAFELVLWQTRDGERLKTLPLPVEGQPYLTWNFTVNADWTELLYGSSTLGQIWHYDIEADVSQLVLELETNPSNPGSLNDIQFHPDNESVFVIHSLRTSPNARIREYEIDREDTVTLREVEEQVLRFPTNAPYAIMMLDAETMAITTFDGIEVRQLEAPYDLLFKAEEDRQFSSPTHFAADDSRFIYTYMTNEWHLYNWRAGEKVASTAQYAPLYADVYLSPDEAQIIALGNYYSDFGGRTWQVTAPEETGESLDARGVRAIAFSPEGGTYLAYINTADFGPMTIVVEDRTTGTTQSFETGVSPTRLHFIAEDQLIAMNDNGYVIQYDLTTGEIAEIKTLEMSMAASALSAGIHQRLMTMADNLLIGSLCENTRLCQERGVYIWDLDTEDIIARLDLPAANYARPVANTADGLYLWTTQCTEPIQVGTINLCPGEQISHLWDLEAIVNAAAGWTGDDVFAPSIADFAIAEIAQPLENVVFSPQSDDTQLTYATWNYANDVTINRLELTTGEEETLYTLTEGAYSVDFNATGDLIAVGKDGYVELWRLPS